MSGGLAGALGQAENRVRRRRERGRANTDSRLPANRIRRRTKIGLACKHLAASPANRRVAQSSIGRTGTPPVGLDRAPIPAASPLRNSNSVLRPACIISGIYDARGRCRSDEQHIRGSGWLSKPPQCLECGVTGTNGIASNGELHRERVTDFQRGPAHRDRAAACGRTILRRRRRRLGGKARSR